MCAMNSNISSFVFHLQKCLKCNTSVYPVEELSIDGKIFHKTCFKCEYCNGTLSAGKYASIDGKFYCKPHYKWLFSISGNYVTGFSGAKAQPVNASQPAEIPQQEAADPYQQEEAIYDQGQENYDYPEGEYTEEAQYPPEEYQYEEQYYEEPLATEAQYEEQAPEPAYPPQNEPSASQPESFGTFRRSTVGKLNSVFLQAEQTGGFNENQNSVPAAQPYAQNEVYNQNDQYYADDAQYNGGYQDDQQYYEQNYDQTQEYADDGQYYYEQDGANYGEYQYEDEYQQEYEAQYEDPAPDNSLAVPEPKSLQNRLGAGSNGSFGSHGNVSEKIANSIKNLSLQTDVPPTQGMASPPPRPADFSNKLSMFNEQKDSYSVPRSQPARPGAGGRFIAVSTPKCPACNTSVYPVEEVIIEEMHFHKSCFRCSHCNSVIKPGNYASLDGRFFCKPHYKQLFSLKGNYNEGFGSRQHKDKWIQS